MNGIHEWAFFLKKTHRNHPAPFWKACRIPKAVIQQSLRLERSIINKQVKLTGCIRIQNKLLEKKNFEKLCIFSTTSRIRVCIDMGIAGKETSYLQPDFGTYFGWFSPETFKRTLPESSNDRGEDTL